MLSFSVVKSAGSAGNYYTDKDNYYVLGSMGERWAGQGAEQLGLQGSVDKDVFTRLLEGRLPDGADLSRMQDGSNKHRPGYDLTFSAPKSVSMMAMLGGDKRLIDAHNQAVDFAVRQVEALASTRVMTDGQSETVLTGNLVMALFNHDTSRDQDPQLHTHVVVANVTQHNGEWKTLSSDKVGKTGFSENVLANRIAFGKIYQSELRQRVEALGYETEVVGKHGMWEMPGVPVEAFSSRSQAIREAVGEGASLKSRDVAALDTRKSKQHVDPEIRMAEWMQTLKETGFDIRAYRDAADQRAEIRTRAPGPVLQDGPDVQQAVTQAIAGLSERKVQFTYTDVLARTVGILPPENGVIERARAGIDEAISREQLIPLDREKGLFTSGIHVLDELSVRALSRDIMKQNRVTVHPEKSVPRTAGYSDAVSVLAQDRPSLAIVSGQGGAAGQRERVAELVMMAREQGREVQIIAADRRSQMNLKQDERLSGELITGRRQLQDGMTFTPGSTVIVRQLVNDAAGHTQHLRVNQIFKNGNGGAGNKPLFPGVKRSVTHCFILNTGQQFCNLRFQGFIPGDGHICIRHHLQTLVRIVAVVNFCRSPLHNRPEDIAVSGTRRQGGNLAVFPKNQRTGERHDKFFQLFVAVKHSVFFQRLPYDILVFQHPLLVLVAGFVTNR